NDPLGAVAVSRSGARLFVVAPAIREVAELDTGSLTVTRTGTLTMPADVAGQSVRDRKSTRLNSSHVAISYAVFCLKKKNIASVGPKMLQLAGGVGDGVLFTAGFAVQSAREAVSRVRAGAEKSGRSFVRVPVGNYGI